MAKWLLAPINKAVVNRLAKKFQLNPVTAQILSHRGLTKTKEVAAFLNPAYDQLHSPEKLTGAVEAAALITEQIKKGLKIAVFGDYDVDGLTATALLVGVLKKFGAAVWPVIPSRFNHGYGLHPTLIQKIIENGFSLIITVDCGITNLDEVLLAKQSGLKVIIIDHHQPPENLPPADIIVNPKQKNCSYPFKQLAGVGLAYKVAQLVAANFNQEELVNLELDLVALGTVCDVVPLVGENRVLTALGLQQLEKRARVGLAKLCQVAGLGNQRLTSEHLAFILGPRINAAGRLTTAHACLHLFLTADETKAAQLALKLHRQNQERNQIEEKMLAEAAAIVSQEKEKKTIVVAGQNWHEGVRGIVASRLVDYFYRPAVVFSLKNGLAEGSARSVPGFNLYKALAACQDVLVKWGGHEAAAGLSVSADNIELFKDKFEQIAAQQILSPADLQPTLDIDAAVSLNELSLELFDDLSKLAPFGEGNPFPKLLIKNVYLENPSLTTNGKHIKLFLAGDGPPLPAVMFRAPQPETVLRELRPVDVVGHLSLDSFNGKKKLKLKVVDYKLSEQQANEQRLRNKLQVGEEELWQPPLTVDWRNQADVKEKVVELLKQRQAAVYLRDELSAVRFNQQLQQQGIALKPDLLITGKAESKQKFKRLIFYHPPLSRQVFSACQRLCVANAIIYLAYNQADIEESIRAVKSLFPDRELLALTYRALAGLPEFDLDSAAFACRQALGERIYPMAIRQLTEQAIAVFKELNFITEKEGVYYLQKPHQKAQLITSARFRQITKKRQTALQFLTSLRTATFGGV